MIEEKTKLFIKRERIRRNMINTRMGGTICLQEWEIKIILDWIKELESEVKKHEFKDGKTADFKSKVKSYGRW